MQSVQRVRSLGPCICICRCSVFFFFFFDFMSMSKPVLGVGERLDRINLGVHIISDMSSSLSLAKRMDLVTFVCAAFGYSPLGGSDERVIVKVLGEELVLDASKDIGRIIVVAAIAIHILEEGSKVS